jgi:hypothetical protein
MQAFGSRNCRARPPSREPALVKEYDLYVPLTYNDGTPIEAKTIERIGRRLLEQFGGVTFFPQPNEGLWRMGEVTFRDQIVIFRVLSSNVRDARRFFRSLKVELKTELEQEEILVVEKDVETL